MANDFDQFPLEDSLIRRGSSHMSDIWIGSISNFYQNIISYLKSTGMFIPVLTTAKRDTIQSPQEGQMIYNSTIAAPQIFQGGLWKTFTTV